MNKFKIYLFYLNILFTLLVFILINIVLLVYTRTSLLIHKNLLKLLEWTRLFVKIYSRKVNKLLR